MARTALSLIASLLASVSVFPGHAEPLDQRAAAVFAAADQAKVDVRDREALLARAEPLRLWQLPAPEGGHVAVGPDFDWTTGPTGDPDFLRHAMALAWLPDLARAEVLRPEAGYLAALEAQVASFNRHLETAGGRRSAAWRDETAAIRAWSLLEARRHLPGDSLVAPRLAAMAARDLRALAASARARLEDDRPEAADGLIARALLAGGETRSQGARVYRALGEALVQETGSVLEASVERRRPAAE